MPIYSDLEQLSTKVQSINTDINSIYQSITNILNTPVTERFFNPEFGSELDDLLFEPIDRITEAKIYRFIVDAIDRWEPRVVLDYGKSTVKADEDQHKYIITLIFDVIGISPGSFTFSGILQQ